jgi:hypothetical protein
LRFRWSPEFKGDAILKVPGRKKPYRSLDERCSACVVKGGTKSRCFEWPAGFARDNPHGYPCPRREWPDPESVQLSNLVGLGAHGESGHLFARGWEIEFGGLPREEQGRLYRRLMRAYADEVLKLALWPKPE